MILQRIQKVMTLSLFLDTIENCIGTVLGPTRGYQLGCQLAYTTQCLQYLDTISHHVSLAQGDRLLMETEEVYSAVSSLYSLTFSSRGREAVTRTVSMASNVDCLLALTHHSQQSGKKDMKKSASRGFASELLLMVVRGSDNAEWLGQYAGQLMVLGSSDSHSKLSELVAWVSPAQDSAVFTQSGLDSLISVVKQRLDSGEPELDRILTCELVTAVRLLQFHVTPSLDTCPILGTRVASRQVLTDSPPSESHGGTVMDARTKQYRTIVIKTFRIDKLTFSDQLHRTLLKLLNFFIILCELLSAKGRLEKAKGYKLILFCSGLCPPQ